jgi:hypothetical protein
MWQRECLPPKTLIPPRRLHRIRGRYAALSTLVRRAYIQRRTGTGQLLFPFSKYAPVTTRFPVHKPATIKLTHYLFGLWQPLDIPRGVLQGCDLPAAGQRGTGSSKGVDQGNKLTQANGLGCSAPAHPIPGGLSVGSLGTERSDRPNVNRYHRTVPTAVIGDENATMRSRPISSGKESAMRRRPYIYDERLSAEKARIEVELIAMSPNNPERVQIEFKLHQIETALRINSWISSPGLQSPG